jgi:hypothetical protein
VKKNRIEIVKGLLENSKLFEFEEHIFWSWGGDVVSFDDLKIALKEVLNKDFTKAQIEVAAEKMVWEWSSSSYHISSKDCHRGITVHNFIELMDALAFK